MREREGFASVGEPLPDYDLFIAQLSQRLGLRFKSGIHRVVVQSIERVFRESSFQSRDRFVQYLYGCALSDPLFNELIYELSNGESYFFRNRQQLDFIEFQLLPFLLKENSSKTLRVWSAGCSTGEEVYSLGALISTAIGTRLDARVLGSDLSKLRLDHGRRGRYQERALQAVSPAVRAQWFEATSEGAFRFLSERLQCEVSFQQFNLMSKTVPSFEFKNQDLIVCRNVLIYFEEQDIRHILQLLYDCLRPGGWLVLGTSEYLPRSFLKFEQWFWEGQLIFRRPLGRLEDSRVRSFSELNSGESSPIPEMSSQGLSFSMPAPPLNLEEEFRRASGLADRGLIDDAIECLENLLNGHREAMSSAMLLVSLYERQGQVSKALRRLLRFVPRFSESLAFQCFARDYYQRHSRYDESRRVSRNIDRLLSLGSGEQGHD